VAGVARRTTRRTVAVVAAADSGEASAQAATAQQQAATAQQQSATAQQQSATAAQQSATAQQQVATAAPAGQALPLGTVVTALPSGCAPVASGGVEYQKCGSNYYRTAFQGSNLVYVTAQP
jgi:glucose/arabinose dehydrogenase